MPSFIEVAASVAVVLLVIPISVNIIQQILFRDKQKPPVVWHWLPIIGNTIGYGQDPYAFFFSCREKYGDIFTFTLLGMKVTVYLGTKGNSFILNGKHKDLNAEEIYGPLTVPIFGPGVVYDIDNARFMDQKRLVKEGFSTASLTAYVPQFVFETEQYVRNNAVFDNPNGVCDISSVISEIALYCSAGSLQGREVREAFDSSFAVLFRHLDDGFAPINFMLPGLPLPVNRRRDHAQQSMAKLYMNIILKRRKEGPSQDEISQDMLWALMDATYKNGERLKDDEISNLMIALLMGGQHNTASIGTWIMLHLAHRPQLIEELYAEQQRVVKGQLTYTDLSKLVLHNAIIKETLRLHTPIHSVMRKVRSPMAVPDSNFVVPAGHVLLAAPSFPSRMDEYFPNAMTWNPHRWLNNKSDGEPDQSGDGQHTIDYGYGPVHTKAASSPYLPFGAGRHRCVGETFAYAQLTVMITTLVKLLQWEQVDPATPVPETDYSSMFSRPMHPATVRWRKRETKA